MHKSKIDFISELLAHKKISVAEKERLFGLTKNEILKMGEESSDRIQKVIERIERLEREQRKEMIFENHENGYQMYHMPQEVTNYLNMFRENTVLKWTTHIWDENKYATISEFIDELNQEKSYSKIYHYNINLYNLIRYFLYIPYSAGKDERGENKIPKYGFPSFNDIKIGWQYPDNLLINWCKEKFDNKGEYKQYPFEYVLPENLRPNQAIKGKMITTFENVVDIFKTEIQFRDNYFYKEIKKRACRMLDYQFEGIEQFKNLNFYTYTSGVLAAIDIILHEIKRNETEKNIIFSYFLQEGKLLIIDITHQNSFPTKRIIRNNPFEFIGGGLNAIAENLFSLCDFSIISTFQDNTETGFQGELNILHEKSEGIRNKQEVALKTAPILKDYVEVVKGFTYRLKFNL